MRITPILASLLVVATAAGCLDSSDDKEPTLPGYTEGYPRYEPANDLYHYELEVEGELFHFDWAPGAIGKAWNKGDNPITVELPQHFLLISGENGTSGSFSLAPASFELAPGTKQFFLAPPSATTLSLKADGVALEFDPTTILDYQRSHTQFVSGENWYNLSEIQEANFPHRTPGQPNYAAAQAYFAQYFEDLGYEVSVDPYGTTDLPCVPLAGACPSSVANVVAMKPGTTDPGKIIFVAGGHYDMVPGTTHAAFDDTSGTLGTLELARALAPYDFRYTLAFGLWGGEEDGILGSQFWVQSNPDARARVLSYWNLDVIGMSWPSAVAQADPHVISAGPDAPSSASGGGTADPVSQSLLTWAQTLQQEWFAYPEESNGTDIWYYEGVASGQAGGYAAVNAQSDHTPFMAAGIPAYFSFNGDALADGGVGIHNERDTLANMTKYAFYGPETDFDADFLSVADYEMGRSTLEESIETVLVFPLYHTLLVDLGVYTPPGVAGTVPVTVPPV